jgi:hypothetical protein
MQRRQDQLGRSIGSSSNSSGSSSNKPLPTPKRKGGRRLKRDPLCTFAYAQLEQKGALLEIEGDGNCLFRCLGRVLPGRTEEDYHDIRQEIVSFMGRPEIGAQLSPFFTPNDRLIRPDCKARSYAEFLLYLRRDKTFGDNFILGAASMLYQSNFIVFPSEGTAIEIKFSHAESPVHLLGFDLSRLHYDVVDWSRLLTTHTTTSSGRLIKAPAPSCLEQNKQVRDRKLPWNVRSKNRAASKRYRERKKKQGLLTGQ